MDGICPMGGGKSVRTNGRGKPAILSLMATAPFPLPHLEQNDFTAPVLTPFCPKACGRTLCAGVRLCLLVLSLEGARPLYAHLCPIFALPAQHFSGQHRFISTHNLSGPYFPPTLMVFFSTDYLSIH